VVTNAQTLNPDSKVAKKNAAKVILRNAEASNQNAYPQINKPGA
jgi:hypothetical protein